MKKVTRYISVVVYLAAWIILATASTVSAQNYSVVTPIEPDAVESVEEYSDVALQPSITQVITPAYDISELANIAVESSNYTLGMEDVIGITVLRHPEVSGNFIVNKEGKIQYAFIGDVNVEGMKKDEVKELLTKLLSEYIITPDVTVQIIGFNSKKVYVIGEVRRPGKIIMYGDTITVREALIQAGLPLLTAKAAQSRLITPSDTGKVKRKIINIHKLLYEGDLRENLIMSPGDTLYVPPTIMAKAMRVIQPISQPINAAGSTGRRVYTGGF